MVKLKKKIVLFYSHIIIIYDVDSTRKYVAGLISELQGQVCIKINYIMCIYI